MNDLAEFLLARIAEDERFARNALSRGWVAQRDVDMLRVDYHIPIVSAAHIARWDPARVLAECDAKRRIVGAVRYLAELPDHLTMPDRPSAEKLEAALLAMAAIYADHPDFREEWKP